MSNNDISRRSFLKLMGWGGAGVALTGCDLPSTVTIEEGKETVVSYLSPEEYIIPGVGVWYSSTCEQCSAHCGIQGRVREGRVLKVEGNPESPISGGKLCQTGQASLQSHYNPDRIRTPMMRKGNALTEVSWEEAQKTLDEKVGSNAAINGERFAWMTGEVSGHQAVLIDAHLNAMGSKNLFVHDLISPAVGRVVNQDMLGQAQPIYKIDKARVILSFGSDFLGVSPSTLNFSRQYSQFRSAPRGVLIQIEPKMTLTGANADLWIPAKPGTEGALALGILNILISEQNVAADQLPADIKNVVSQYDKQKVTQITGVPTEKIERIAQLLKERSPSLVLSGPSTESQPNGYAAASAVMLLNLALGNVGKTIVARGDFPFSQLEAKAGNSKDLIKFAERAGNKDFDVVFFYGTNPVYTAPKYLALDEKLKNVPFKVAFSQFLDETTAQADLVLPLASCFEGWGTHVPAYQPEQLVIGVQQPLMEKLYPETKGFGDIMLTLLKSKGVQEYGKFEDYYAYLVNAFSALPGEFKNGLNDQAFWNQSLQKGQIKLPAATGSLSPKAVDVSLQDSPADSNFPYYLVPSPRAGLLDGRHANLPWLQEAPDQISKVVWDSWAEIHPVTAQKLGVKPGDFIKVTSAQGSVDVPVCIHKGMHPDAIAVPMGQGHEEYGRYAKGIGVNPLKILSPVVEAKTGELALYGTRVNASKSNTEGTLVKFGGSETQVGRKLVATVRADVFNRTEGA